MKVGFITPTLHTLGPRWQRDPQVIKLAVPTLSGYLYTHGFPDIRQYDFEVQIFKLEAEHPGKLDLRAFFEDGPVDRFLTSDDPYIRSQAELIVDTLQIEEAALFGLSCASVLELYADMHAAGNINLCICKILKERFPKCRTVIGGMQISPQTKQREEYRSWLRRCAQLDYTIEGKGAELALYYVAREVEGTADLDVEWPGTEKVGNGRHVPPGAPHHVRVPAKIAREEGLVVLNGFVTPEDTPEGDHVRKAIKNETVYVTPYYDPKNVELRKERGFEILKRYHLDDEFKEHLKAHLDDKIAILPMIFMEGCNARCAFCAYSMTKMVKRDVQGVVSGLAWLREQYDVRYFHFLNTNINASLQYAEVFCDAIIAAKLDILWSDCANLWALNERLIEKLAKSGCIRLTYGVECPSDRMLDYIHKGINVQQAHERLKLTHEAGIWNHALLITGLPTETEEDVAHFIDFLEKSKDYVHGYSISSFYLNPVSLMGMFPHRYNLEQLPSTTGLLEDAAFNEIGGLDWAAKKKQIVESTRIITDTVRRIKGDAKYWSGAVDLELIFWLYDRLGRENKAEIVRAYETAFLVAPAHPKSYLQFAKQLLANPSPALTKAIAGLGAAAPSVPELGIRNEAMVLPLGSGSAKRDLELRVLEFGGTPNVAKGRNLGASADLTPPFAAALEELAADGSDLDKAVRRVGWSIIDRKVNGAAGLGFRLAWGEAQVDVLFSALHGEGGQFFIRGEGVGASYKVPHGAADATKNPKAFAFLQQVCRSVIARLETLPEVKSGQGIDAQAVSAFSRVLIDELEAHYASDIAKEPTPEEAARRTGRRLGGDLSKVQPGEPARAAG